MTEQHPQSEPPTTALWHPFSDMGAIASSEFMVSRADGCYVYDKEERRYLDATAALWYANLGHCRSEIADAVSTQLRDLDAYSIFGDYSNEPSNRLAERLAALAPQDGSKVFLGSGGGDAIDTAAKIARVYFSLHGEPERSHLIYRRHAYHGTHGFGTSIAGIEANAEGWGPLITDTSVVAHDDADALEFEIERVGANRVAAFFCEPVIGAGGVHLPPKGYIEAVAEVCSRHNVLFVADCVICGFGRLGTWLGIDRWPVKPDLITLAKGLSNGALPVGAVLAAPHLAAPFFANAGGPLLRHGATYAGHPTCCAAALAALDVYEAEGLIPRGRELEGELAATLQDATAGSDLVTELRAGLGLLAGMELREDLLDKVPGAPARLQVACREAGVLVRPLGRGIAVSPPLTITAEQLTELGRGIAEGLLLFTSRIEEFASAGSLATARGSGR